MNYKTKYIPNWLRAPIEGYGAKKLGGGCFTTILVFVVIYYALGQCNRPVLRHASVHPSVSSVQIASMGIRK